MWHTASPRPSLHNSLNPVHITSIARLLVLLVVALANRTAQYQRKNQTEQLNGQHAQCNRKQRGHVLLEGADQLIGAAVQVHRLAVDGRRNRQHASRIAGRLIDAVHTARPWNRVERLRTGHLHVDCFVVGSAGSGFSTGDRLARGLVEAAGQPVVRAVGAAALELQKSEEEHRRTYTYEQLLC